MKKNKYIGLALAAVVLISCEKHEIQYDAEQAGAVAEFQLHYMNPVNAVAANNINKVEINGKMIANSKAPLTTYNAIPKGSVGRFYTVTPGNVNIKLYYTTKLLPASDSLVYDQNVTLTQKKQNVFVHDFNKPPVVFDNLYPYVRRQTVTTDSITWVRFYNFLYETAGVPTTLKLQYQYVSHRTSQPVNIGSPVAFGESTGWEPVLLLKSSLLVNDRRIDYKIKVVDDNGNVVGDLQIKNSSGKYVAYSDYWTGTLGRFVHHTLSGMRDASPACAVRLFTAL